MLKKTLHQIKTIMSLLLVSLYFISSYSFAVHSSCKEVITLDERIIRTRDSFEDVYYELVKQNFFGDYYNNNLIIKTKIDTTFLREGEVFLYLIDWLDKQNDRDSQYLLKKLSKYLYLIFYQHLCLIDTQKNQSCSLLRMLKDIYKNKIPTPYGIFAPFRAALSELIVLIFIFNFSQLSYEKKRESMAYMLHQMENKFLVINTGILQKKIADEHIKEFIQVLQAHITKEPLVHQSVIKKVACTAGIIALVSIAIPCWAEIKSVMKKVSDNVFEPIGRGIGSGVKNGLLSDPEMMHQIGQGIIHGIAVDNNDQPNPDIDVIAQRLGNGLIHGIAHNDGQPNPDVAIITNQLREGLVPINAFGNQARRIVRHIPLLNRIINPAQ